MSRGKPDHVFDVVRTVEGRDGEKPFWKPIGRAALWIDRDAKKITGRLELNLIDGSFHLFERDETRRLGGDEVVARVRQTIAMPEDDDLGI